MNQILVVASSTLREHARRKILMFFGIFSVLLAATLTFIWKTASVREVFQAGEDGAGMTLVITGSSVFGLFALIAALVTSMGNIGRPFSNGEALAILARPVSRAQFALGRFAAGAVAVVAFCALLALQLQIVLLIAGGTRYASGVLWEHWATTAFNLVIVSAIGTLFSALIPTPSLVAVIGYFVNQVVAVSGFLHRLAEENVVRGTAAQIFGFLWLITPKYLVSRLAGASQGGLRSAEGIDLLGTNSLGLVVWALAWLGALLAITIALTNRKEI